MGTARESERDKIVRRIGTEINIIALGQGKRGSIDDQSRDTGTW